MRRWMRLTTAATSMTSKWPLLWLSVGDYSHSQRRCTLIQRHNTNAQAFRYLYTYLFYCIFCVLLRSRELTHDYEQVGLNIFIKFQVLEIYFLILQRHLAMKPTARTVVLCQLFRQQLKFRRNGLVIRSACSILDGIQHLSRLMFYDFHLVKIEYVLFCPIDQIKFAQLLTKNFAEAVKCMLMLRSFVV